MNAHAMDTRKADANQTLVFMLIAGAVVLFTTFTASYLVRRESADWARTPIPPVVWWNTALIALSSVTMEVARRRRSGPWMEATGTLAVIFGFGQILAWLKLREQGAFLASNPHASFFYVLTLVHAFHLAAGLATLAWAIPRARTAQLGLVAAWWHFVGAAWVWVAILLAFF
jgi:cytochrome c oxidase subunit III